MDICRRFALLNSTLHIPPPSFPTYPLKLTKFSQLPFLLKSIIYTRTRLLCTRSQSSSSTAMEAPPQGYRRNVGICLVNDSKKIFAASRLDIPSAWQMPQGGIDEAEDPRSAAIRELREETGVKSTEILAEAPYWLTYNFPPEVREKLWHQLGSDWEGHAQKWLVSVYSALRVGFLLKFTGKDDEINLLGDGSEKPEFGEWSWTVAKPRFAKGRGEIQKSARFNRSGCFHIGQCKVLS